MKRINLKTTLAMLAVAAVSTSAMASLTFSGSSGSLAASATFTLTGSTLTVNLVNTSSADVLAPTDVLTGVFFNTAHILTTSSASLNGSSVNYGSLVNNVGEGWQYGSPGGLHGKNSGISAAGLGAFGSVPPNQWFFTPPVTPLDGTDYGILSAGDNLGTGNTGVTGHGPLFKNSILFTLTVASGFTLADLGDSVVFQYGTALDEPSFTGTPPDDTPQVPEPTTVIAGALLLLPFGASTIRVLRNRKA